MDDWSRVRAVVTKNMFHSCSVETKTEALPEPPNPVAQILGVLGPLVGGGAPAPVAAVAGDSDLEAQIAALVDDAGFVLGQLKAQSLEVETLVKGLPARVACTPQTSPNPCTNALTAQSRLDTLAEDLQGTPQAPIASTTLLTARAAELTKTLTARMTQPKPGDGPWLKNAFDRLRWAQENIEYAGDRRQALIKARDALLVVRERIIGFTPSTQAGFPVSPAGNARTVVTVTCVNVVTQQPAIYTVEGTGAAATIKGERLAPVSAAIVFRNKPWATVSGGLLYSLVDKREVGVAAYKTGTDAAGVVTYERRVTETNSAASQVVPFSFFNVVIPGLNGRNYYGAGSVGFGLNLNNGPKNLEYFIGGAIGIGRFVVINVGLHLGTRMEPDNRFAIGDVLPAALTAYTDTPGSTERIGRWRFIRTASAKVSFLLGYPSFHRRQAITPHELVLGGSHGRRL